MTQDINVIVAGAILPGDSRLGIGFRGKIPWRIPQDIEHFKCTTADAIVIMGRRTWESIPQKYRPLAGRMNIIVSHSNYSAGSVHVAKSLEDALAYSMKSRKVAQKIFVIGGESLYNEVVEKFSARLDHLYLTEISNSPSAPAAYNDFDTYFPLAKYLALPHEKIFLNEITNPIPAKFLDIKFARGKNLKIESIIFREYNSAKSCTVMDKIVKIKIDSQDTLIEWPYDLAIMSATMKAALDKDPDDVVVVTNVKANELEKIRIWCVHNRGHPPHEIDTINIREFDPFELAYVDMTQPEMFQLILAANYLDMKPLLTLLCKAIAKAVSGKTPEQIKTYFGIQRDFSPEEYEYMRKEREMNMKNNKEKSADDK